MRFFILFLVLFSTADVMAEKSIPENFLVVIREAIDATVPQIILEPEYPQTAEIDGESLEFNMAWYSLIGDTQIRFVLDGEHTMSNVEVEEFEKYGITVEQGITEAIANQESIYGKATYAEWQEGIYIVSGGSVDLDSSHFLNARLWAEVDSAFPDGIVAAIPDRGTLIFAPISDENASTLLVSNVKQLKEGSESLGISKFPYLRQKGSWKLLNLYE